MKLLRGQRSKAIDELDKILALLFLFVSLTLTIWLATVVKQPTYTLGGILVFLACATYLIIRKRLLLASSSAQTEATPRLYLLLNIIFFILLSYSIISFHLRPELYVRPLSYFISTALMAAIVTVEILHLPARKSCLWFALFKITLIALSLRWSQVLIFPNVVGADPWAHQAIVNELVNTRHIVEGQAYSKLPLMHLMSGATSLITGLNYKIATLLSITSLQVILDALFIFLLGQLIFNDKVGLLAALFLGIANHHIFIGYVGIPNTMGATLLLPLIYLLFKIKMAKPTIGVSLSLLLMAALILTHTVATMCMAIFLFVFFIGFHIYHRAWQDNLAIPVTFTTVMVFTVAMFGWWTYVSGHMVALVETIKFALSKEYVVVAPSVAGQAPLSEQLFSYLGMLLFIALSLAGFFYMVSRKFTNRYSFIFALGSMTLLALCVVTIVTGSSDVILWHRWIEFSQIMLAIPVGVTFILVSGVFNSKLVKTLLPATLTLILVFFMVISPQANFDNRTFYPSGLACIGFTESELQAMDTISDLWDGEIGTDWHSRGPLIHQFDTKYKCIDDSLHSSDFNDCRYMLVMVRREVVEHPFVSRGGLLKLDDDPNVALAEQGFSRLYDCGSISGFIYTSSR